MCGITGFIDFQGPMQPADYQSVIGDMTRTLNHRGPDDSGTWIDEQRGIALGHRRLSILDLSPEGHQPMRSADGRFVIVFNGEIYNFQSLRAELEASGHQFRGHSDTEVLLAAMVQWGIEATLKRCVGMFALAVWDRQERALSLARDRMGEKPLYYGWQGTTFLFGSELKALRGHPSWSGAINRGALALFVRHGYVPAPYSIYQGISKLPPGTVVTLRQRDVVVGNAPEPETYWSLRQVAEQGLAAPFSGSEPEAIEHLDSLLRQVVRGQMIADVPLGAFLSGGVDSSTIVALMQAQSTQPVKTFTIGFHESIYNEAVYAKAVAEHLGTDHTEMYVTPEDALAVIPRLPTLYDEPFGDSSQIPTFLVSELAHRHVTVSLSGDGGDELFAGYTHYREANTLWKKIGWVAPEHRYALARLLDTNKAIAKGAVEIATRLYGNYRPSAQQQQVQKIQQVLQCSRIEHLYRLFFMTYWRNAPNLVFEASSLPTVLSDSHQWMQQADPLHRMMYLDSLSYLPDDILVKVDRAAMGVSLETRVPLLDHRVVEQVWQLPLSMKVRQQQSKWLLRQLLYQYVPRNLIERPKTGFGVPLDTWLRGPLRDWAEALLAPQRVRDEGFFAIEPIQKTWQEHLEGRRDWQYYLWNVLMFQAWLEAR